MKSSEKLHREVLNLLETRPSGFTSREVQEKLERPYQVVINALSTLWYRGNIRKEPCRGRSYRYIFLTRHLDAKNTPPEKVVPVLTTEISPETLADFLTKWSQERWKPRIFNSARRLPVGLAELFSLAIQESYGAPVGQMQLNEIKAEINGFKKDLEQTLRVVNGMLQLEDLWTAGLYAPLLLNAVSSVDGSPVDKDFDELKGKIQQVKELNNE